MGEGMKEAVEITHATLRVLEELYNESGFPGVLIAIFVHLFSLWSLRKLLEIVDRMTIDVRRPLRFLPGVFLGTLTGYAAIGIFCRCIRHKVSILADDLGSRAPLLGRLRIGLEPRAIGGLIYARDHTDILGIGDLILFRGGILFIVH